MALIVGVDLQFLEPDQHAYRCTSAYREGTRIIHCNEPSVCQIHLENKYGNTVTFPSCWKHIHSVVFEWP